MIMLAQDLAGGRWRIWGKLFAPRYFRATWALPALLVSRAAGIAIVREAYGVRFEGPECVEGPTVFTGFEDGPDLVPNLAFFIARVPGSIFGIGCLLVHGSPCFLSCRNGLAAHESK